MIKIVVLQNLDDGHEIQHAREWFHSMANMISTSIKVINEHFSLAQIVLEHLPKNYAVIFKTTLATSLGTNRL